jgi:hypothetical protein
MGGSKISSVEPPPQPFPAGEGRFCPEQADSNPRRCLNSPPGSGSRRDRSRARWSWSSGAIRPAPWGHWGLRWPIRSIAEPGSRWHCPRGPARPCRRQAPAARRRAAGQGHVVMARVSFLRGGRDGTSLAGAQGVSLIWIKRESGKGARPPGAGRGKGKEGAHAKAQRGSVRGQAPGAAGHPNRLPWCKGLERLGEHAPGTTSWRLCVFARE